MAHAQKKSAWLSRSAYRTTWPETMEAILLPSWSFGKRIHGPVVPQFVMGAPDPKHVSTSYVERQNLTMRMSMRRFTRLTNGFSKKVENHGHAVAIYFMYYNFCRIHKTLRVTPAMEAGLTDHVWSIEELVALLPESKPAKRGPYKKRLAQS
jgi:hypothetical protein